MESILRTVVVFALGVISTTQLPTTPLAADEVQQVVQPVQYVFIVEAAEEVVPEEVQGTDNVPGPREMPEWVREKISHYAEEYGVLQWVMEEVVRCETAGTFDPEIQSQHFYPPGSGHGSGQEQSFGLAQIHLPAHPHVSYEEATDPDFALEFMAKNMAEGQASMWTCWKDMARE